MGFSRIQIKKINTVGWLAQSLDLDPIKNLYGNIKNAVSEENTRNVEGLWNKVHQEYHLEYLPEAAKLFHEYKL